MAGKLTITTLSDGTTDGAVTDMVKGSARAWLNYNSITQVIKGSYNVSSVTYNAAGDFTVNFTNAMVDANYSVIATTIQRATAEALVQVIGLYSTDAANATTKTTSAVRLMQKISSGASTTNSSDNSVAIFR